MWNWKRFFFLTAAILALGTYYFYSDFQTRLKNEDLVQSKKLMVLPEGTEMISFLLESQGKDALELVKEDSDWWVNKPRRYKAEDFVAEGLRTALTVTTWERSFPLAEVDLGDMGLKSPAQKVTVVVSGSQHSESKRLLIGRETPTSRYVYAMWEKGQEVFMLHDQFARSFDKSLYAVRKKRIFDIPAADIYAVDIHLEGKSFTLVKRNGKWHAVSQGPEIADPALVETFVSELTSLYVKEFLDGLNPKNPDLGLSPGKYSITITRISSLSYVLWVGKENKEKKAFYVLKEGEETVLLLPADKIKGIPRDRDSFRKKRLHAELDLKKLEKIYLRKATHELTLVKVGDQWKFQSGKVSSLDQLNRKVRDLVRYIKTVRLKQPVTASEASRGLDAMQVRLASSDKEIVAYTFYKKGGEVIVEAPSQKGFYKVEAGVWKTVEQYFQEVLGYRQA